MLYKIFTYILHRQLGFNIQLRTAPDCRFENTLCVSEFKIKYADHGTVKMK